MKFIVALFALLFFGSFTIGQTTYVQNYSTMTSYITVPPPYVPLSNRPFSLPIFQPSPNNAGSSFQMSAHVRELSESEKALEGMKKSFLEKNYLMTINQAEKVETGAKGVEYNECLIGSYEKLGQFDKIAIEAYQRDLKFNEKKLYHTVAYALTINGLFSKADIYFALGEAYDFSNTSPDIIFWRSYNCLNMGLTAPAQSGYDHLIRLGYKDISIYFLRADILIQRYYHETGSNKKPLLNLAIRDLGIYIDSGENKVEGLALRATAKFLAEDYAGCIEDMTEPLKKDPLIENYLLVAQSKMLLKDFSGSLESYKQIVNMFPNNYRGFDGVGLIKSIQGDYEGGLSSLHTAIKVGGAEFLNGACESHAHLAYTYFLMGNYSQALSQLSDSGGYLSQSFMANFLRASCLIKGGAGALDEACQYLMLAYECGPSENPLYSSLDLDELIKSHCDILKGWEVLDIKKQGFSVSFPPGAKLAKDYYLNYYFNYKLGQYYLVDEGNTHFLLGVQKSELSLDEHAHGYTNNPNFKDLGEKIIFAGCEAYKFKWTTWEGVDHQNILFKKGNLIFCMESTGGTAKSNAFFGSFRFEE